MRVVNKLGGGRRYTHDIRLQTNVIYRFIFVVCTYTIMRRLPERCVLRIHTVWRMLPVYTITSCMHCAGYLVVYMYVLFVYANVSHLS